MMTQQSITSKGIYLASYKDRHLKYNIVYNDIVQLPGIDLCCDLSEIDLEPYDFIIATPPCNFWSRANWRADISEYALKTKKLLPNVLYRCTFLNKPFIIENVRNYKKFNDYGIWNWCNKYGIFIYELGRHTYFTNVMINISAVPQVFDDIQNLSSCNRQGGYNVHNVIDFWLDFIHENKLV